MLETTKSISLHFPVPPRQGQPYDPNLKFNRLLEQKNHDFKKATFSIDPVQMLKTLEKDQLTDLAKLTFAARPTPRENVGLWDVLFNYRSYQGLAACIMTTKADYSPIPQERVAFVSKFLNPEMSTSRIHLNQLIKGDRIGIAINNLITGDTYVLLYVVDEFTAVRHERQGKDSFTLLPAVNVSLHHVIKINHEGQGSLTDMNDQVVYDHDTAQPFVEWLFHAVCDITNAYPWKPHFLPLPLVQKNPELLESSLLNDIEIAKPLSYDDFLNISKTYYYKAKELSKQKKHQDRSDDKENLLPIVQVLSYDQYFIVKYDYKYDESATPYRLDKIDLGRYLFTETYLTNKDIGHLLVRESDKILNLSSDKFGPEAYLRLFSVNF